MGGDWHPTYCWWFCGFRRENQLRLVVYPIIYKVYCISQVVRRISSINSSGGLIQDKTSGAKNSFIMAENKSFRYLKWRVSWTLFPAIFAGFLHFRVPTKCWVLAGAWLAARFLTFCGCLCLWTRRTVRDALVLTKNVSLDGMHKTGTNWYIYPIYGRLCLFLNGTCSEI